MKDAFHGLINRLETAKKRVSKLNKMSKETSKRYRNEKEYSSGIIRKDITHM